MSLYSNQIRSKTYVIMRAWLGSLLVYLYNWHDCCNVDIDLLYS